MPKTKKDALRIVFSAADEYNKNFIDHKLLFLCIDRSKMTYCVETTFWKSIYFPEACFILISSHLLNLSAAIFLNKNNPTTSICF